MLSKNHSSIKANNPQDQKTKSYRELFNLYEILKLELDLPSNLNMRHIAHQNPITTKRITDIERVRELSTYINTIENIFSFSSMQQIEHISIKKTKKEH